MPHLKIKPTNDADVLVVGAGPAGALLPPTAQTGLRVALIDQHAFPRDRSAAILSVRWPWWSCSASE
jgi:flavin-dependent dehydrogenase